MHEEAICKDSPVMLLLSPSYHYLPPLFSNIIFLLYLLPLSSTIIFYHYLLPLSSTIIFHHYFLTLSSSFIFCHYLLPLSTTIIFQHYLLPISSTIIYYHYLPTLSSTNIFYHYLLPRCGQLRARRYILGNVSVAVAPATYLSSDTRFWRYSATATFIDKASDFLKTRMIHT